MEELRAEIPEETLNRLKWLSEKTGLSQETLIITALIIGSTELKKELLEDD